MSDNRPHTESTPQPGSLRLVLVMGAVGLMASVLLVATYQITNPYIEANRAAFLEQAVLDVLPGTVRKVTFVRSASGELVPATTDVIEGFRIHAGYDQNDEFIGVAVEARGQGFQDVLSILYGYVPECECVVGMKVLASKETPGLGDKIETDPNFLASIDSLDIRLNPARSELLHEIGLVKQGGSLEAWDVAAITGATISSEAVATIINDSAEEILPVLYEYMDDLRQRDAPQPQTASTTF